MLDSGDSYGARLHFAAAAYRDSGWSVIPIRGDSDPGQPKAAAVSWSVYQQRLPTDAELRSWFLERDYRGLAIVCGSVSRLAVLDFDDSDCAESFARVCPDLVDTMMVRSGNRRLPHYYYRVPENLHVPGKRTACADFQVQGTYVVAPPTVIAGCAWSVENSAQPRLLSRDDVCRIHAFLESYLVYVSGRFQPESEDVVSWGADVFGVWLDGALTGARLSAARLVAFYRRLADQIGRNNALFRSASLARDLGWSLSEVKDHLLGVHVVQPAVQKMGGETVEQRRREGLRTIASAFRYVSKPNVWARHNGGLPNSIREALLQTQQAAVARVIDGLLLAGMRAGSHFTERIACELLRVFRIGRRSVQAALRAVTATHEAIFPPWNPPKTTANAAEDEQKRQTKCNFVSGANRVKIGQGGRTPHQFVLPDHIRLYRLLRVRPSGSDPLKPQDLGSPEAYRCAMQRALIARRPGCYSRRWLAARLGVSVWTCRRYDRQIGLIAQPVFEERWVSWTNLDRLPLENESGRPVGVYLETGEGRRYPPVRGIAARLLALLEHVTWKRQGWNYYRMIHNNYDLPDDQAGFIERQRDEVVCEKIHKKDLVNCLPSYGGRSACSTTQDRDDRVPVRSEPEHHFWLCPDCLSFHIQPERPGPCHKCRCDHWELIPETTWRDVDRCKAWWRGLWQQRRSREDVRLRVHPRTLEIPLNAVQRALAERLYRKVRECTPERSLTRTLAGRLVGEYGHSAVESALQLLSARPHVTNAAGFIVAVLRSEHRTAGPLRAPNGEEQRTDDHAAWMDRLRKSPYAQFYANADHFLVVETGEGK